MRYLVLMCVLMCLCAALMAGPKDWQIGWEDPNQIADPNQIVDPNQVRLQRQKYEAFKAAKKDLTIAELKEEAPDAPTDVRRWNNYHTMIRGKEAEEKADYIAYLQSELSKTALTVTDISILKDGGDAVVVSITLGRGEK